MGRRLGVINFPVQFKQHPDPKKYPYEKKLDDTIDQMIEEQADLFMTWCLTAGIEYVERVGMKCPQSVLNETQSYRNDCDWVSQFRQEFIVKTFNEKDALRWNTVLTAATTYYKAHCTGRLPRVVDLRKMFEKALGEKLHNWEWRGWLMPGNCTQSF
jgi:phage/plasmid-associated DNA primase